MNEVSAIIAELVVGHVGFWLASVLIVALFYPTSDDAQTSSISLGIGGIGVLGTVLNAISSGYPYNVFDIAVLLIDSILALWMASAWARERGIVQECEQEHKPEHERGIGRG